MDKHSSLITVYLDQDYSTLGPAATESDLDGYASNLAEHLAERFNRSVQIERVLGGERAGRICPEDDDIDDYVRELHAGDGWINLLPEIVN